MKTLSKKSRRQQRIVQRLEIDPAMRVQNLSDTLNVSTETIRRDLAELEKSGQLKRTYGGAVRTSPFEPVLSERLKLFVKEREKIAQFAVEQLREKQTFFIGGGATTQHFARALKFIDHKITVITASLGIASELAQNAQIEVIILPGRIEPEEGLAHGPETLDFIRRYRTQVAIMGASALDETGMSEALSNAAQVYQAMVSSCDMTYVLADHSKVGHRSLQMVLEWNPQTALITNTEPGYSIRTSLTEKQTQLLIA